MLSANRRFECPVGGFHLLSDSRLDPIHTRSRKSSSMIWFTKSYIVPYLSEGIFPLTMSQSNLWIHSSGFCHWSNPDIWKNIVRVRRLLDTGIICVGSVLRKRDPDMKWIALPIHFSPLRLVMKVCLLSSLWTDTKTKGWTANRFTLY